MGIILSTLQANLSSSSASSRTANLPPAGSEQEQVNDQSAETEQPAGLHQSERSEWRRRRDRQVIQATQYINYLSVPRPRAPRSPLAATRRLPLVLFEVFAVHETAPGIVQVYNTQDQAAELSEQLADQRSLEQRQRPPSLQLDWYSSPTVGTLEFPSRYKRHSI